MNTRRKPAQALYLYRNPTYLMIYNILGPYKNYLGQLRTPAYNKFNKIMSNLRIEVKHEFPIHQNL